MNNDLSELQKRALAIVEIYSTLNRITDREADILHRAITMDRPKGEWINEHYDGLWYHTCNRCKTEIEFDRTVKRLGGENFCRNCGADMRGEKDE